MPEVAREIERELLRDQHRALLIWQRRPVEVNARGREGKINVPGVGSAVVRYDGLRFAICDIKGEVYVNNVLKTVDEELPHGCVITIGAPHRGLYRDFIEFDVSHPEVVL